MPGGSFTMNEAGDFVPGARVEVPPHMRGVKNWYYSHSIQSPSLEAIKEHSWEDEGGVHTVTIQCPDCNYPLSPISRRTPGELEACPSAGPVTSSKTVGRNDPCSCGSGKKYKKCHGAAK